jgi:acyl-CoA thioesterase II
MGEKTTRAVDDQEVIMTSSPRESLGSILTVERVEGDEFGVRLEDFWGASLTCDALARAALAAAQSCGGAALHSLHARFVEPAPPGVALRLRVERLGEDGAVVRRRVQLRRENRLLSDVTLSFASPSPGLAYQGAALDPDLPDPETVPSTAERARAEGWADYASGPIEFRRIGAAWPWPEPSPEQSSTHREWVRPRQPLPREAEVHMAATVFLSDFYSHWTASDRLGARFRPPRFTPLEHALWLHRPLRWDGWWLLRAVSEVGHAGRLFTRRQLFSADGALVASAAQEGLYAGGGD